MTLAPDHQFLELVASAVAAIISAVRWLRRLGR
jgi:hypothetical protein